VLIILIILSSCYSLFSNSRFSKKFFKELDHGMKFNRLFSYYEDLLRDDNRFGKDVRIYHQSELILKSFNDFNKLNTRFQSNIGRLQGRFSGINAAVTSIISGFVYLFVGIKALNGSISIGSVVQYVGAINQFTTSFSKMITSISDSWHNIKYVQLYFDFLDTPSLKSEGQIPISIDRNSKYEIEFRNVSFKYLESDAYALRNISLKINSGERIAVVGMNGSGKTTFIKLLCRLYDPQEGQILLNGVNIQQYKFQDYMNFLSVVFQDFQLFAFPLGQNVSSDINYDEQRTLEYLDDVGIGEKVRSLPNGLETPLYKVDEDGVDISGGEAQKIAIARALYKDSPFIILDEPTAALDPRAEFDIYSKLQRIVKNKTIIFISHRLSSCRFCNEILVLDKGKLIQKGTHDELVQDKSGKYFELWNAQAQYYQLNS
jgi:ATP-binding cassette subfamily B protein